MPVPTRSVKRNVMIATAARIVLTVWLGIGACILHACGSGTPPPGTGTVGVFIQDGAIQTVDDEIVSQLWLRITCIKMHGDAHTAILYDGNCDSNNPAGGMDFDLLALEPSPTFLGVVTIPSDKYTILEVSIAPPKTTPTFPPSPYLLISQGTSPDVTPVPVDLSSSQPTTFSIPLRTALNLGIEGVTNVIVDMNPVLTADASPAPLPIIHIDLPNNFSKFNSYSFQIADISGTIESTRCAGRTMTIKNVLTDRSMSVVLGLNTNLDVTPTPTPSASATPTPDLTATPSPGSSPVPTPTPTLSNTDYFTWDRTPIPTPVPCDNLTFPIGTGIRVSGSMDYTHRLFANRIIVDPPAEYPTPTEGAIATFADNGNGAGEFEVITKESRTPIPIQFNQSTAFYDDSVRGNTTTVPLSFFGPGQWVVVVADPMVTPLTAVQVAYKAAFYPTPTPTDTPTDTPSPTPTDTPTPGG